MACDHAHVVMVEEDLWECRECGAEMDLWDMALLRERQERDAEEAAGDAKFHRWQEDQVA